MSRIAGLVLACILALVSGGAAAEAPDELAERVVRGSDAGVAEIVRAGGTLVPIMFVLSVGAGALAVYLAMECRPGKIFRAAFHSDLLSRLAAGDRSGALAALEKERSLYARAAAAAFAAGELAPAEEHRAAASASAARDSSVLRGRAVWLAQLGSVAALAGFLGTAVGMLQAFAAGAREEFGPVLLYAAVTKALVTSVMGMGIATFALAAYFAIRARLERALADAGLALDELARALRAGRPQ